MTNGGLISGFNVGGGSGVILLDGATLRGGTVATSASDPGSVLELTDAQGTLDGTAGAVAITAGSRALVTATQTLTMTGTIANSGIVSLVGDTFAGAAAVLVTGSVMLTGGGTVSLADGSGAGGMATQVIEGNYTTDTLNNDFNTIIGYGQLGDSVLNLINGAQGTIDATSGTLLVDTGGNAIANAGVMEAIGGTLLLRGVVDDTTGGTIAALHNGGGSGLVVLDGATIRGGQITTDLKDFASMLEFTSNGGTLDGTSAPVMIGSGGQVVIAPGETLTAKGSIVNLGTIGLDGDLNAGAAVLAVAGSVTLSGGGQVSMADGSGNASPTSQTITGTLATDTLDNVDNLISGYGQIGAGTMTLINETKGTIEALGGTITVDTGAKVITNSGLLDGVGATLLLRGVVDGTKGGTVGAFDALGIAGMALLDGATMRGGTIATDLKDPNSSLQLTSNGGTLDGTSGAVTLAVGAQAVVGAAETLTVKGAIVNHGTLSVTGNLFSGNATLLVNGAAVLSGGGTVSLSDASGYAYSSPEVITGSAASASLENVDNTISGYGELGNGTLTLSNDAKGTIEATGGTLTVSTRRHDGDQRRLAGGGERDP